VCVCAVYSGVKEKMPKRKLAPQDDDIQVQGLLDKIVQGSTDPFTHNLQRSFDWDEPNTSLAVISERTALLTQIKSFLDTQEVTGTPSHERTLSKVIGDKDKDTGPLQPPPALSRLEKVDRAGVSSTDKFRVPTQRAQQAEHQRESRVHRAVRLALKRSAAQLESVKTTSEVQVDTNTCEACSSPLVSMSREASFACPNCGPSLPDHGLTASVPNLFDAHEQQRHSSERRKNTSLLFAQFQVGVSVPQDVLARLREELAKLHVHSHKEVRVGVVREILDINKDSQWKPFAHRIVLQLIEAPMPSFTREEIDLILKIYDLLQFPLLRSDGSTPNSKLVARVCCATLGLHEMKGCFPLLKDASALRRQDQILANMFARIGIPFCPSI